MHSWRPAQWFYKVVRNRNIFKQSISLTYKDKAHYINFFGGISTILMVFFIFVYGILMIIRLFNRTDVQWNRNFIEFDSKTIGTNYTLTEDDDIEIMVSPRIDDFYLYAFDYEELFSVLDVDVRYVDDLNHINTTIQRTE